MRQDLAGKNPPSAIKLKDLNGGYRKLAEGYVGSFTDPVQRYRYLRDMKGLEMAEHQHFTKTRKERLASRAPSTRKKGGHSGDLAVRKSLSNLFGTVTTYNPSRITYSVIEEMRREPQINLGLSTWAAVLKSADWYVECVDKVQRKFITDQLERCYSDLINPIVDDNLEYGHSAINLWWQREKIKYEEESGDPPVRRVLADRTFHVVEDVIDVSPKSYTIETDKHGKFLGIRHRNALTGKTKIIDNKYYDLMFSTFDRRHGNHYGNSIVGWAFVPYQLKQIYQFLTGRWHERQGSGQLVIYHPPEPKVRVIEDEEEVEVWTQDHALELGQALQDVAVATAPWDVDDKGNPFWQFKYLEAAQRGAMWKLMLEYYDLQMLRAMLVPDRALQQDNRGTSAGAESSVSTFMSITWSRLSKIEKAIQTYFVEPHQYANFSPEMITPAKFKLYKQNTDRMQILKQIFVEFMRQFPNYMSAGRMPELSVAFAEIGSALGVPLAPTSEVFEDAKMVIGADKRERRKQRGELAKARQFFAWLNKMSEGDMAHIFAEAEE